MKNRTNIPSFLANVGIKPASKVGKLTVKILSALVEFEQKCRVNHARAKAPFGWMIRNGHLSQNSTPRLQKKRAASRAY